MAGVWRLEEAVTSLQSLGSGHFSLLARVFKMDIRLLEPEFDWEEWLRLRQGLWPEDSDAPHLGEMRELVGKLAEQPVFVAERPLPGRLCGFIEIGLRSYAAGCASSPVPYIEGWYIDPDMRGMGVGRALVQAAESWARQEGFTEMASDAELHNVDSHRAHAALGYAEVERVVLFRKELKGLR